MALLTTLRLHPWASTWEGQPGASDEDEEDERPYVDPAVEVPPQDWRPLRPPAAGEPPAFMFVDGVRRIDVGVVAQDGDRPAWGLFGSYGAGAVVCRPGRAQVVREHVCRSLVLAAAGYEGEVNVPAGSVVLAYRIESVGEDKGQNDVRREVQQRMRMLEAELVASGDAPTQDAVVVVDGPITFLPRDAGRRALVAGLIKTHHRYYLEGTPLAPWMTALAPGERTPIFVVRPKASPDDRFSWYVRLAEPPPFHHSLVGIVRLETWAQVGLERARALADLTAAFLPRFAPPMAWDDRAPNNLYPVAALEQRLRHGLGDYQWVRRSIESFIYRLGGLS
jgi:hypothetical protein